MLPNETRCRARLASNCFRSLALLLVGSVSTAGSLLAAPAALRKSPVAPAEGPATLAVRGCNSMRSATTFFAAAER